MDMLIGVQYNTHGAQHNTHGKSVPEENKMTTTSKQQQQQHKRTMTTTTMMTKKKRKRPMKVVYISNPVYVTTTEADFKVCVQDLTGRYSNVADLFDPSSSPHPRGEIAGAATPAAFRGDGMGYHEAYFVVTEASTSPATGSNNGSSCSQELLMDEDMAFSFDVEGEDVFASYEMLRSSLCNEPLAAM